LDVDWVDAFWNDWNLVHPDGAVDDVQAMAHDLKMLFL